MQNFKPLYIFTGKGGVGKTSCALAFAKYLNSIGKKAVYTYIAGSSIGNDRIVEKEIPTDIQSLPLDIKSGTKEYVELKLKSKIVANLIVRAPFFKSLVSMMPGFNYLIYLGKIIYMLKQDPELHFVFDSPSSGHALTMLQATGNYSEIFKSGILFEDTRMIKDFLFQEQNIKVNIISIPTEMSLNEGLELKDQLKTVDQRMEVDLAFNQVLPKALLEVPDTPPFLYSKIENEMSVIGSSSFIKIPFSNSLSKKGVVQDIIPFMEKLV